MIALITRVGILPNKLDQAVRIAKTSVKSVEQRKGYLGLYIMIDRENGELVSVSLWESEMALKAIQDDGFADQHAARLSTVTASPILGTTYEVVESSQVTPLP